jgi:type I restriction-modification system DNA methylase subunit
MDRRQAERLVEQTFQSTFDKGRLALLVKNLLNHIEEKTFTYQGTYIPSAYQPYVSRLERIGKYSDGDHIIDVLIIYLRKETSIERARSMQRNFIAWYLNGSRGDELKDAALVAFVSPTMEDWRFSLIRMDYRFEEGKGGRVKVKQDFTPARRWSFLVGKNENSHTAQSRLAPIIADDAHDPTLKDLEDAFNIEKVTKEFFERYRELYFMVKEELDKIVDSTGRVREDFEKQNVSTVDFTKKLLGQVVFLYFLQKKGWFGVARDAEWGTGPKGFLRELFLRKHGTYTNFFNDILEPLFYEALARERDGNFYSRFNCKIPFLNGGLFDPIGGYDWVHTDILLPDELFSNDHTTKEGDRGDGILDVFDRYNFTVKEDEPLEKEVAVDPEMLGKVFENLLEVKDRRSKGTYYTPRELVHFMCRQSLVNYLHTSLTGETVAFERVGKEQLDMFGNRAKSGQLDLTIEHASGPIIPKADIETLIQCGEQLGENEAAALERERRVLEGKQKSTSIRFLIPETVRQHAQLIDEKLAAIKVCDPAIGSGAFPVGMMSEIVKTRNVLSVFIKDPDRSLYRFKRECIEKSLYGVDIDRGAAEIAKLRLWLSLVVDEDDIGQIKPLPNLDYKIVCGDSLGSVRRDVLNDHLFAELESLKTRYFDETSPGKKKEEKSRIDSLINRLTHNESRFDYHIFFSEAFDHGSSGFDVVIANPPYVRQEGIKVIKPALKTEFGPFFCGTADIYTYFYKRGTELLKTGGHLCFIAPNKFMRAGYGKNTRELLTEKVSLKTVIDFCDLPIFDATTYPSILLVEKRPPAEKETTLAATFTDASQLERIEETLGTVGFPMPVSSLRKEGWSLERPEVLRLMEKLRKAGTPLGEYVKGRLYYGIKTGFNEAFVIDEATRARLIAEDPKSAELIKPWLRGRDIKKWKAEWAGLYVIFTRRGTDIEKYPAIKRHLAKFREHLEPKKSERDNRGRKPGPYKWFEIQDNIAYYEQFNSPKIIYPDIAQHTEFTWDESKALLGNTAYIIPTDKQWLVGLLNSTTVWWFYVNLSSTIRGGFVRFIAQYMEQLPIPALPDGQKTPIAALVQQILADPGSPNVSRLEAEIDRLVYRLYDLTADEIAIVEAGHEST